MTPIRVWQTTLLAHLYALDGKPASLEQLESETDRSADEILSALNELETEGLVGVMDRVDHLPYFAGVCITTRGKALFQEIRAKLDESMAELQKAMIPNLQPMLAKYKDAMAPTMQRFQEILKDVQSDLRSPLSNVDLSTFTEGYAPALMVRPPIAWAYQTPAIDRKWEPLSPDLSKLTMPKQLERLAKELITDVDRAHLNGAYIAATLLYRSIIETILLGLLLSQAQRAKDPNSKYVPKDKTGAARAIEEWNLEHLIGRAVEMELMDSTDESSLKTLQEYGNLIHPGRLLRKRAFRDPVQDATIAQAHLKKLLKRHGALPA